MGRRESARFEAALDSLYAGVLDAEAWDRAFLEVGDLVGGSGLLLGSIDALTGVPFRHETRRVDPDAMASYVRHWVAEDVRYERLQHAPIGVPQTEAMLVDLGRFRRSAIYNELLVPNDSPHFLSVWVQRNDRRGVVLSVQGARRRGEFTDRDARMLARLAPHVRRVVEIKDRLERLEQGRRALLDALDRLPLGVFVLDDQRRILHASRVGAELLAARDALHDRGRVLACARASDDARLAAVLAGGDAADRDDYVRVRRTGGGPTLALLVTALHGSAQTWLGSDAATLVMAFDPARRHLPSASAIAEILGVTPAEARLAARLASGETLREAATALGISPHTARTQLKSIYRKTGHASQAALVRAIAIAPARLAKT